MRVRVWLLIVLCFAVFNTSCVRKGMSAEYVFTYAENHPKDYPTTLGAFEFARLVKEKSKGRIIINVVYDGKLGDELSVIKQIKFGGIDFARASISPLSNEIPILNVLQMPYLYRDDEHMWNVLSGDVGKEIFEDFEGSGIEPLSFYTAGARSFYNSKRPIEDISDLSGLKIRVQQSELMKDMVRMLGAEPVAMEYGQVYGTLQRGVIDGAENNTPSYISALHFQYAGYYTKDEHTRVPEVQICSKVTFDKLSNEDKDIIREAALESSSYERKIWDEKERLYEDELLKKGVKINTLSENEREHFKEVLKPLYEKYCSDYMDLINKINEK